MCRKIETFLRDNRKQTSLHCIVPKKMLPPFPTVAELDTMDQFPHPEGYQYEFKENLICNEKLISTVCAFLNHKGGYIVVGIRDMDLSILGLPKSCNEKKIDSFILNCDNIFHQNTIVKEDGSPLDIDSLRIHRITTADRRLVVLEVIPKSGTSYQTNDGNRWIRVAASNYHISTQRLMTLSEFHRRLTAQRRAIDIEYKDLMSGLGEEIKKGAAKMDTLEYELRVTQQVLYAKILQDKAAAEKAVAAEKTSTEPSGSFLLSCFRFLC